MLRPSIRREVFINIGCLRLVLNDEGEEVIGIRIHEY